jgi:AcrR family transcriptional regulator
MLIPARILRAGAETIAPANPFPTARERARHERILKVAKSLLAQHGRPKISLQTLATGLSMSAATLKKHFADLDSLLADILRTHLLALSTAIGAIPRDHPNRPAAMREAYYAFTRTPIGGLTDDHLLLTRDSQFLPEDERTVIEQTHANFGYMLAPACPAEAMLLLDAPYLALARIEFILAPLLAPQEATQTKPPARRTEKPAPPKLLRLAPPPEPDPPNDLPGAWIYAAGRTATARAPPG